MTQNVRKHNFNDLRRYLHLKTLENVISTNIQCFLLLKYGLFFIILKVKYHLKDEK